MKVTRSRPACACRPQPVICTAVRIWRILRFSREMCLRGPAEDPDEKKANNHGNTEVLQAGCVECTGGASLAWQTQA
jgi:hypothetical protein